MCCCLQAGDSITFSWKFVGIKVTQNCYHGDTLIADCESPVTVQAKDVSAAGAKVTFTVKFTDVCGEVKEADYSYTQAGVTAETKVTILVGAFGMIKLFQCRGCPAQLLH